MVCVLDSIYICFVFVSTKRISTILYHNEKILETPTRVSHGGCITNLRTNRVTRAITDPSVLMKGGV